MGGVATKRRSQSRTALTSAGQLLRQPTTSDQRANQRGCSSAQASIPASPNRYFLSAAEMNEDLFGCSEMQTSAAATSGELCNSELMINLTSSISQLVSSLAQFKITNSTNNRQDVCSVWVLPEQNTGEVTRAVDSVMNTSQTVNHNIPETCLKESIPCKSSPLGFHLPNTIKEKI